MLNYALLDEMQASLAQRDPIKVGIVGFGYMGSTMFGQLTRIRGMCPAAVFTSRGEEARRFMRDVCGIDDRKILETTDAALAAEAIARGMTVITNTELVLPDIETLEVIVDATGNPEIGARVGWMSLEKGKHVATFNVEADSVVGSILRAKAQEKGLIYTGLAGDEPAAVMELINFASFLEFPILAVGKGKNNALRPSCTPDMFDPIRRTPSAKSMCSFVDGTNTMIEMAAVANAVGLRPDTRGMHGPTCTPDDLASIFVPKADGGILEHERVVDYTMGTLAPGVFAVVRADHPVVDSIFSYVYKRQGSYLALVRPYHLLSLEAPISIAQAVIQHRTTIASSATHRTAEVIAVAKRDLLPGERIDGIGGYTVRGVIEQYDVAVAQNLMPIGVLEGAFVLNEVKAGQPIAQGDVRLLESSTAAVLWKRQRAMLSTGDAHKCSHPGALL